MDRTTILTDALPPVCRLGLATRGGTAVDQAGVEHAIERGVNYLNWCGYADGMSAAIGALGRSRGKVVVATQLWPRTREKARRKLDELLRVLRTDHIDVVTHYWVESESEWDEIRGQDGALEYLVELKRSGVVRMIGLTSHQRKLAAEWARSGLLDLLMIRYNAAHRGAEQDVFPVTSEIGMPVVTYTGLRWRALLKRTREDPRGYAPPRAPEWYRFCLAEPRVSIVLTAPGNRAELDENLRLLEDWRAPGDAELDLLRQRGDRVRRNAGQFP